jgi:hypothetical protein
MFARGRPEAGGAAQGAAGEVVKQARLEQSQVEYDGGGDLTDLLRACLVVLRLPPHAEAYRLRKLPFWGVNAAAARITRLLDGPSEGAELGGSCQRSSRQVPAGTCTAAQPSQQPSSPDWN